MSLERLPPELLQTIAYDTHVLSARDVGNLKCTSAYVRYAVSGGFADVKHKAMGGFGFCVGEGDGLALLI